MQKVTEALFSLKEATASFTPQGFVTKCFIDEVKNFAANILLPQVGVLVTYQELCIVVSHVLGSMQQNKWRSYIEEFRGSEAVEGFCCKFIYGDCRVQGQRFCIRFETSLFYSGLLFGKVSLQVFYSETVCFIGFSKSSYLVLFTFSLCMILMLVCFIKVYS